MTDLFLSLCRFDFDFSLEESIQRRLDLSVKNSVSFMSRERELIGKVYTNTRVWDAPSCNITYIPWCLCDINDQTRRDAEMWSNIFLLFLVAHSCSWTWIKLTSRLVSHNGNNLYSYWNILCYNGVVSTIVRSNITYLNNLLYPSCFFQVRFGSRTQLEEWMLVLYNINCCFCDLWLVCLYIQLKWNISTIMKEKKKMTYPLYKKHIASVFMRRKLTCSLSSVKC